MISPTVEKMRAEALGEADCSCSVRIQGKWLECIAYAEGEPGRPTIFKGYGKATKLAKLKRACGYILRTTAKWLNEVGPPICLCNHEPMMCV